MSLRGLQSDFCAFLRKDSATTLASVPTSAQRGLKVYHYAHRATLAQALADVFERTHGWLGDARFASACRVHIASHMPTSWTLADYGRGFEQTLALLYPDNPELADLAWLDWSLREAFNGPDSPEIDLATLTEIDWDRARLSINPTLACRRVGTNVALLWQALEDGCSDPPEAQNLSTPAVLTVWRQALMPRYHTIELAEHGALVAAQNGAAFGEICQAMASSAADTDAAAATAGAMLGRWIAENIVVAID